MDDYWTRKAAAAARAERARADSWRRKFVDPIVGLTGALVLLSGATAYVAYLQWRTFEKTDDTTWATNRPWLRLTPKLNGPVVFTLFGDSRNIAVSMNFSVENVGNIPATDIHIFGALTQPPSKEGDVLGGVGGVIPYKNSKSPPLYDEGDARLCEMAKELFAKNSVTGPPVFPKQTIDLNYQFDTEFPPDGESSFVLVGCVLYRTGKTPGRTGFRLAIGTTNGSFRFETPNAGPDRLTKRGSVPIGQVKVQPENEGNFAE
jgi:hypothetical protein